MPASSVLMFTVFNKRACNIQRLLNSFCKRELFAFSFLCEGVHDSPVVDCQLRVRDSNSRQDRNMSKLCPILHPLNLVIKRLHCRQEDQTAMEKPDI